MIDIHSHLVFDVDDGPSAVKESILMVLEAGKLGINGIISTPHYNQELYNSSMVKNNFDELCTRVAGCGIKLYQGYEVFLIPSTPEDVRQRDDLTLNRSRYLLFELPFDCVPKYYDEVLTNLVLNNYTPILAHPERYRYFIKDFNRFLSLVELGCLVQLDAASIIGVYGPESKSFAKKLIKLDLIHFVASDAHCADDYTYRFLPAYRQVQLWGSTEYADKVFCSNPKKILDCSMGR